MSAIRNHLLRAMAPLAIAALAAIAFAQTTVAPKAIKITPETAEAEVGQKMKLALTGLEAEARAMWIALPADVAAVDDSGAITFFAPGAVRVIAIMSGSKPLIAKINVKPARVKQIVISKLSAPLIVGGAYKLDARAVGANGDPRDDVKLEWASTKPSIAVVDSAGLVTGIAPGKATLVAKSEGASGEMTMEQLTTRLNLTPEQQAKISPYVETRRSKMQDVHSKLSANA